MGRIALVLAFGADGRGGLPSPGLYLALGLGHRGDRDLGWIGLRAAAAPGFARLAAAAAITVGGARRSARRALRIVLALAAIRHLDRLIG